MITAHGRFPSPVETTEPPTAEATVVPCHRGMSHRWCRCTGLCTSMMMVMIMMIEGRWVVYCHRGPSRSPPPCHPSHGPIGSKCLLWPALLILMTAITLDFAEKCTWCGSQGPDEVHLVWVSGAVRWAATWERWNLSHSSLCNWGALHDGSNERRKLGRGYCGRRPAPCVLPVNSPAPRFQVH